eukprot:scaffold182903_cov43-Attheya_sp.AAC.1
MALLSVCLSVGPSVSTYGVCPSPYDVCPSPGGSQSILSILVTGRIESIAIDDPSQMKTRVYQGGSELLTGLNPYIDCQPCRTRRH